MARAAIAELFRYGRLEISEVRAWLETIPLDTLDDADHAQLFEFLRREYVMVYYLSGEVRGDKREKRKEMIRLLLSHGVNANSCGHLGRPLSFCATPAEAALLLDAGARIDAETQIQSASYSPLWHTTETVLSEVLRRTRWHSAPAIDLARSFDLVRFFVSRGADFDAPNSQGVSPARLAHQKLNGTNRIIQDRQEANPEHRVDHLCQVAQFLDDVRDAGGWAAYVRAPRIGLVRLRALCIHGRAAPPADKVLDRLFSTRLPNECFWNVLAFWRSSREIFPEY